MIPLFIYRALGKLGDNRAVPSLIKALDTNDFNTATKVIEALGKIGDKRAEPALKTILEKELGKKLSIWSSSERAEAILYSLDKVTGEKWSNSFMEEKGKIFYPDSILNKINGMFSDIHMWGTKKVDCDILGERLDPSNPNYNRLRQWICERWIKRCPSFNCQKALIKNLNELELVFRIETRDKREYLDTASLTLKKSGNKWNIVDVKEGLPAEEASFKKTMEIDPNYPDAKNVLEKLYLSQEEAKKQQIPSLQEEGSNALKNKNWNAAVQAYKKLLEIAPENYDANTNIGKAYTMLNEFDLSIKHLTKAQQLKPAEYQPYYLMGIAYARKGDKDRAIDSLRDAIYKGYKDLSVSELERDTNFPEDFKQDQRFKGLLGKLEINKLISDVKDIHLFDNHSQTFPYKYDNVWDAVNYTLKDQDEKIIQSDKETGIIVTDTCRWAMSREYYKYYILVEGANDTSTKLQLRLVAHDSVFDEKLRRSVLKPMNSSYANKKINKFLERVKKVLEKNK